ncbi:hypothetical protein [Marilutibacter spongiae]|uniref:Cytochrome c n=1 Tax=Marilutibacter spongiae TaxID=2025720 RepID=A0A7W3TJK9_9GAMM|nr:hypothetical protein [Lysobacter spongiae]MBB1059436.1 hypothetical protein [Lysobacter spongiae]
MNDPQPNDTAAKKPTGNAQKFLFMLILGLVLGAIATVMAMRALQARKDHFPDSVMQVQQWHLAQLRSNVEHSRCSATDTIPHIKTLREMANDLEPAFPDLRDDERFVKAASGMRAALDTALGSPPLNCPGVEKLVADVGGACKACHQDFR